MKEHKEARSAKAKVMMCNCWNRAQAAMYGGQNRVHNYAEKPKQLGGKPGWRCTVCGNVKPA